MGGERGSKLGSVSGFVTGILLIAVFAVFSLQPTGQTPEQLLANFDDVRLLQLLTSVLFGLAAVFAIPYFIALRNALRRRAPTRAASGAVLAIVGIVLLSALTLVQNAIVSVLADVYANGSLEQQTVAIVLARATLGLFGAPFLFALFALSVGFLAYGFAMRESSLFPNWIAYTGIVTGIVGVVGVVTVQVPSTLLVLLLNAVTLILFVVFAFASSVFLWRSS